MGSLERRSSRRFALRIPATILILALAAGCSALRRQGPVEETPATPTPEVPAPQAPEPPQAPVAQPETPPRPTVTVLDAGDFAAGLERYRNDLAGRLEPALAADELGYYLDVMEARLRQQFGDSALQFERDANRIRLTLPVEAAFERNSDRPGQVLKDWLSRLQQVLAPFTQTLISVHGHTDSSGAASINQRLSERRGLAVAESLRALGIGRERLVVIGHGAARPIADDATLAGQARNRRVELWIDPLVDE